MCMVHVTLKLIFLRGMHFWFNDLIIRFSGRLFSWNIHEVAWLILTFIDMKYVINMKYDTHISLSGWLGTNISFNLFTEAPDMSIVTPALYLVLLELETVGSAKWGTFNRIRKKQMNHQIP